MYIFMVSLLSMKERDLSNILIFIKNKHMQYVGSECH